MTHAITGPHLTLMPPRIAIPVPSTLDPAYNQRCLPLYLEAIHQAGGTPVELPLDLAESTLASTAHSCHGLLLPGSLADVDPSRFGQPRDPASALADSPREATDLFLLEHAATRALPVLAICYGLQILNVHRGGTLLQDLSPVPVNHPAGPSVAVAHTAAIVPHSLLGSLTDITEAPSSLDDATPLLRLPVNSSHHQAVAIPGAGLRVSARCPQDGVIEALEPDPDHPATIPGQFLLAVQWHPERSIGSSATSRNLFRHLVQTAGNL